MKQIDRVVEIIKQFVIRRDNGHDMVVVGHVLQANGFTQKEVGAGLYQYFQELRDTRKHEDVYFWWV